MLTNTTCIASGIILFILFLIVLFLTKVKMIKIINLSLLYFSGLFVVSFIFFPIPYQKEVLELYNNHAINLIPFKQISYYLSNPTFAEAVNDYLKFYISEIIVFIPLGIIITSRIKKANILFIYSLIIPFTLSAIQYLLIIFIGSKYKEFNIESILFYWIGLVFGFLLNKIIILIFSRLNSKSSICNVLYKILKNN